MGILGKAVKAAGNAAAEATIGVALDAAYSKQWTARKRKLDAECERALSSGNAAAIEKAEAACWAHAQKAPR